MGLAALFQINTSKKAILGEWYSWNAYLSHVHIDGSWTADSSDCRFVNYGQVQFCRQHIIDAGLSSTSVNQRMYVSNARFWGLPVRRPRRVKSNIN